MAIIDNTLVFSDGQAFTADAASTNVIDLGATGTPVGHSAALVRDVGKSSSIPIEVLVATTFTGLTSLNVAVQVDDNEAFTSPTTVAKSGEIPVASLVAGYRFAFPAELPEGTNERYVRLYYDVTGVGTAGALDAHIVAGRQTN